MSDFIVLGLVVIAVIMSVAMITNTSGGEYVEIYHKGNLLEVHPLSQNKTISLDEDGHNTVIIENQSVYMSHADCPDQLCVKSPPIKYNGQRIICAPNRIIVIIRSSDDIDGITGGGL
ncbi:MAG: NusG domain II-containing protein [Bacillota bacterium]